MGLFFCAEFHEDRIPQPSLEQCALKDFAVHKEGPGTKIAAHNCDAEWRPLMRATGVRGVDRTSSSSPVVVSREGLADLARHPAAPFGLQAPRYDASLSRRAVDRPLCRGQQTTERFGGDIAVCGLPAGRV
ncbi:hypothetical protein MRX96_006882 [Rhipicephalus microplus]